MAQVRGEGVLLYKKRFLFNLKTGSEILFK
jgi:hypothetical protein